MIYTRQYLPDLELHSFLPRAKLTPAIHHCNAPDSVTSRGLHTGLLSIRHCLAPNQELVTKLDLCIACTMTQGERHGEIDERITILTCRQHREGVLLAGHTDGSDKFSYTYIPRMATKLLLQ